MVLWRAEHIEDERKARKKGMTIEKIQKMLVDYETLPRLPEGHEPKGWDYWGRPWAYMDCPSILIQYGSPGARVTAAVLFQVPADPFYLPTLQVALSAAFAGSRLHRRRNPLLDDGSFNEMTPEQCYKILKPISYPDSDSVQSQLQEWDEFLGPCEKGVRENPEMPTGDCTLLDHGVKTRHLVSAKTAVSGSCQTQRLPERKESPYFHPSPKVPIFHGDMESASTKHLEGFTRKQYITQSQSPVTGISRSLSKRATKNSTKVKITTNPPPRAVPKDVSQKDLSQGGNTRSKFVESLLVDYNTIMGELKANALEALGRMKTLNQQAQQLEAKVCQKGLLKQHLTKCCGAGLNQTHRITLPLTPLMNLERRHLRDSYDSTYWRTS